MLGCGNDGSRPNEASPSARSLTAAEFERETRRVLCPLAPRGAELARRLAQALDDPTPPSAARNQRLLGRVASLLPGVVEHYNELVQRERELVPPADLRSAWRRHIVLHDSIREDAERALSGSRSGNVQSAYTFLAGLAFKQGELDRVRTELEARPCTSKDAARNADSKAGEL